MVHKLNECAAPCRYIPEKMSSPELMKATVSNQDKDIMRMRAFKAAAEEMGVRPSVIPVLCVFSNCVFCELAPRIRDPALLLVSWLFWGLSSCGMFSVNPIGCCR